MADRTPVIPGFHPDPSICRVGDDYYLACSSFEYVPGVPLFHSRDLRHWTQIGNVLDRPDQLTLPTGTPASGGIYAPTLRHHDGRFWLIVTNCAEGGGNLLVTATDPAGPWSDPVPLPGVHGIDPDLAWDEDGTCWCTTAGISQVPIDPYTGRTLGPPRRLWSGTPGAKAPEAPHLYRIDGTWYLLIAEGGTERGHGVSVARGPSPSGPFEPCPANPVLSHRSTDDPVQNTGHADLVQAPDGTWWMVFLGVRPGGGSPGWHVLGRETFLAPVRWEDGWPVVGALVSGPAAAAYRDDFDAPELAPGWLSPRSRPASHCTTKDRPGRLTLRARGAGLDAPDVTFVGRRQDLLTCRTRTRIDPGEGRGGLAVRLDEDHRYEIEAGGGLARVRARIGPVSTVIAEHPVPDGPLVLGVDVTGQPVLDARSGPDTLTFGVTGPDGAFTALAALDGRYLSTEVAGGFTGRVIGLYAAEGTVHFDWFTCEPLPGPPAA
ncbi:MULTISPECIES: glycoside hydrolase family 43 protein [unclassified Streptomyces]|uniref:glycoside hydrolase family 43 protein n=1 Tax=unclassified Streptomyces TaxID=2593676 RepID=UPI000DB9BE6A|nr:MULTISPECIES: glycoside hydrolase family 43 protein [unclassified Streptomyces]MYT74448.1 family 43 glycosylhydrolase [Streptomyces sp. SID8367]RAJ91426.1 beta-xylosidase [Streptomyces sp. PsTaAH-137]